MGFIPLKSKGQRRLKGDSGRGLAPNFEHDAHVPERVREAASYAPMSAVVGPIVNSMSAVKVRRIRYGDRVTPFVAPEVMAVPVQVVARGLPQLKIGADSWYRRIRLPCPAPLRVKLLLVGGLIAVAI